MAGIEVAVQRAFNGHSSQASPDAVQVPARPYRFLADVAEQLLTEDDVEHASSWYAHLTTVGHEMSSVDEALFSDLFGETPDTEEAAS